MSALRDYFYEVCCKAKSPKSVSTDCNGVSPTMDIRFLDSGLAGSVTNFLSDKNPTIYEYEESIAKTENSIGVYIPANDEDKINIESTKKYLEQLKKLNELYKEAWKEKGLKPKKIHKKKSDI